MDAEEKYIDSCRDAGLADTEISALLTPINELNKQPQMRAMAFGASDKMMVHNQAERKKFNDAKIQHTQVH